MNLYQEHILEHYHNPCNRGSLSDATHAYCANNPTCGDKICIEIIVTNGTLTDIAFTGEGCAISQATASMLTEFLKGKAVTDLKNMTKDDILALLEIELSHNRLKCALLSLETAHKALAHEKESH